MQKLKTIAILILFFFALFCRASIAQNKKTLSLNLVDKKLPFGLIEKVPADLPKIGLALSGGGARSFAQLGVIKAFEENNIPFDIIAGTSMGSIVGGLYSAGYTVSDLDSIINNAAWGSFFSIEEPDRNELFLDKKITEDKALIAFRISGLKPVIPTAVNTGQRVANFLNLLSVNAPIHIENNFDELLFNFRAVCTNLVTGEGVVLKDGLISQAMRASSSVSLLLEPVKIDTLVLADGGLFANVPVKAAKETGAAYVIAVDNTSPLHNEEELNYPWHIADQLVSIPMRNLNKSQLEHADIVVEPEIGPHANTDFKDIDFIVEKGYEAALDKVSIIRDEIKHLLINSFATDEFFAHNLSLNENASELEKEIVNKYAGQEYVSSRTLSYELYSIYNRGCFKEVTFDLIDDSTSTILIINETLNPEIKRISLNGVIIVDFEKAVSLLNPLLNKPYNTKQILHSTLNLIRYYRSEGFSLAEVEAIDFDEESQTLHVNISEGIISKIYVEGNYKTDEELITREFPIQEGEYFKYSNLAEGFTNLRATNLFENIELLLIKDYDENILRVNVDEKVSSLIRLGIRIDNENLTQAMVDIRDENIFGTGTEFGVMLSGGIRNQAYTVEHRVNRIFNTYLTYTLRAFYKSQDINVYRPDTNATRKQFYREKVLEYTQSSYGASFGVGTQLKKLGNLILKGTYQHTEIGNVPGISGPLSSYDVFSLNLGLTLDTYNKYPYPTRGALLNGYYETAQTIFSGDLSYTKLFLNYETIFSLSEAHVLSGRFQIGYADKTLLLDEYFSMGGQNSFFGLRDYEFRGRQIFITSAGYRFKLPFKIFFDTYFKLRYDLGATWAIPEEIKFKDLIHGVGVSVSLDTPLGPADFSIGRSFTFIEDFPGSTIAWGETMFYFTVGYYY